jgi:hypothetical protein
LPYLNGDEKMNTKKLAWALFFLGLSVGFLFNEIFNVGKLRLILPLIFLTGISGVMITALMLED